MILNIFVFRSLKTGRIFCVFTCFWVMFWLCRILKIFLEVEHICSLSLKCATDSGFYNASTLVVIRPLIYFLFYETVYLPSQWLVLETTSLYVETLITSSWNMENSKVRIPTTLEPSEKNLYVIWKNEEHFRRGSFDTLSNTRKIRFISLILQSVETKRGCVCLTRI